MRQNTLDKQKAVIYWLLLLQKRGDYITFNPSRMYGLSIKSFERYIYRASKDLNVKYKTYKGAPYRILDTREPKNPELVYVTRL